MGNYENETWAGFGKVCAWAAGIAAAGGALYWIGSEIYDSGRIKGKEEGKEEMRESHDKDVSIWTDEGRLISEEACFRYFNDQPVNGLRNSYGITGCKGLTFRYFNDSKQAELNDGEYSATLGQKKAPSLARKVKAQWEKYVPQ
ncbi:MAG: hypothetical protein AABY26_04275 [Nanoarchaeota archaeon]